MRDVSVRMKYASKAAVCKRDMLRRCYVSGYVKQYATSVVYEDAEECTEGAQRREGALIFSSYLLRWVGWITARYGGAKELCCQPRRIVTKEDASSLSRSKFPLIIIQATVI